MAEPTLLDVGSLDGFVALVADLGNLDESGYGVHSKLPVTKSVR